NTIEIRQTKRRNQQGSARQHDGKYKQLRSSRKRSHAPPPTGLPSHGPHSPQDVDPLKDVVPSGDVVTPENVVPPPDVVAPENDLAPDDVAAPENVLPPEDVVPPQDVLAPEDVVAPQDVVAPCDIGIPDGQIHVDRRAISGRVIPNELLRPTVGFVTEP